MSPRHPRLRSQWISLVIGPVLAVTSFVVAYFVNPLNVGDHSPLAAVPAALFAIVVLLIGQNLATYREVERASWFSDRIYEAVKDYLHVTKVGVPEAAMTYVVNRLPIVTEVRNTTFNLPDGGDRADERFYETGTYRELVPRVTDWTKRGGRWKDLGDPRAVGRLRAFARASKQSRETSTAGYQYRLLAHDEPQINFLILGYADGTEEVLFNWDFRSIGHDPIVLASRDRDIVAMFTVQFEQLWRIASRDHDSRATMSTPTK